MYLTKLTLDARHPGARRDLADAYELHRTLARVYATDSDSAPCRFLWRVEPTRVLGGTVDVLVQSALPGRWEVIEALSGYARSIHADKPVVLAEFLTTCAWYRFRLLANPTVTRNGKRLGLMDENEQTAWMARQGQRHGFAVLEAVRAGSNKLTLRQGAGKPPLTLQSALFEGVLRVDDPAAIGNALTAGIGHGKAFGLGMLSLARIRASRDAGGSVDGTKCD